jgi:hypothetical protein
MRRVAYASVVGDRAGEVGFRAGGVSVTPSGGKTVRRLGVGWAEVGEAGQQGGLMPWGVACPWVMKIMRAEKTSSVMTRPLG